MSDNTAPPTRRPLSTREKTINILLDSSVILGLAYYCYKLNQASLKFGLDIFDHIVGILETPTEKKRQNNFILNFRGFLISNSTMSDNKLVKTILDAATLTGLAAGIGWIAKKVVKESFTSDPSSNLTNFAKFTAVMADSIALKDYLDDQGMIPKKF